MLNALSGVMRPSARSRSSAPDRPIEAASPATTRRLRRRVLGFARFLADSLTATPRARQRAVAVIRGRAAATERPRSVVRRRLRRRHVLLRLTTDRAIPISVALVVLIAAGVSLAPAAGPVGAVQAEAPAADGVRLSIGGGAGGPAEFDGPMFDDAAAAAVPVDDGTLYKPVAVDTSVASSAGMLQHYTVREGDTLTAIANRFGVSMQTVWWANHLTSKDSLKAGQQLIIPPVNGLVVTVKPGDTLDSLAAANKISVDDIVAINELTDTNLIVGQVLVLPGAKGAPLPTPKPTSTPQFGGGGGGTGPTVRYTGGSWAWPVVGGGNYISQYFHYGHYGVDIAADYGTPIVAPVAAHVVFAGWKSNGGGYQVWLQLGNGLYTAQYHMSSVSVSSGQDVAKGQRVGRVGMSGWASGPHCHFEVWVGTPWDSGSYRVNPLRYY